MNIVKTKICSKCKLIKNISEFVKHPQTKDGLQCRCNECRKIEKKEYYKKNKKSINDKSKKYREDNAQKLIDYSRNYYKKNKKKLLEDKKEYYKKNSELIYKKLVIYNKNNKKKVNFYKNNYNKEKKKSSNLFKLRILMRDRINKYFKNSSLSKKNTTFKIIGCEPKQLKEHLENQFKEGMAWDNHGLYGWHIDHIIPLSSAKTEEEIIKLCHYSNLQPLWAKDNLSKGSKISNR
jgi:hypothetical protein